MLPLFCHNCGRIFQQDTGFQCPYCNSGCVQIYDTLIESHPADSNDETSNEAADVMHTLDMFTALMTNNVSERNFDSFLRAFINNRATISSDRRNYAIGPEYDEILERLMDEDKIELQPVSKEFMDGLKRTNEKVECSICLKNENNEKSDSVVFLCGHGFHWDCAMMWLKVKNTCPNCRCVLDEK